jgi:hypothetical protein
LSAIKSKFGKATTLMSYMKKNEYKMPYKCKYYTTDTFGTLEATDISLNIHVIWHI